MKKTLLVFLIVGLLASTGYARGGHGGRRHAGGTISIRGYSTQGNVHPSTGKPGTKSPHGDMGGYSGGSGPWQSGHVEVHTSAESSEMEAQEAGAAVQQRQDPGVSPLPYWSLYNDHVETQAYFWELSACITQGNQRGQGYFFCQETSTGEVVVAQPASVPGPTPVVTTSDEWVFYLDNKDTGFHSIRMMPVLQRKKPLLGPWSSTCAKNIEG